MYKLLTTLLILLSLCSKIYAQLTVHFIGYFSTSQNVIITTKSVKLKILMKVQIYGPLSQKLFGPVS
jgi:hypothetical protein